MCVSLLLLQILEKRSLHGKFNLACKRTSKLSIPFLSRPKVLAPITPGSDLAAGEQELLGAFQHSQIFSRLFIFQTWCLSKSEALPLSSGESLDTQQSRGEGAAFSSCLWVSQWISHSSGPLYITIIFPESWLSCFAGQDSGLILVGEFLYEMFLPFPVVPKSLLAHGGFPRGLLLPSPGSCCWLLISVPECPLCLWD